MKNYLSLLKFFMLIILSKNIAFSQQRPGEADLIKAEEAMSNGNFELWFQLSNKSCDQGNMFACYMVAKGHDPQMAQSIPYPKSKDISKAFT